MKTPIRPIIIASLLTGSCVSLPCVASAGDPELAIPSSTAILATLQKQHPRLLAGAEDLARLKRQVNDNPVLREWHGKLTARAQRILNDPPSRYEIPDGLRLLSTSRRVLDRVYTLGLLFRLDGDKRYVERAWTELEAAANFPDWNPRHFLDTAEMTHAFAIGYDWLYNVWTKEQRDALRAAMVEKGLKPALASYRGESNYGWWVKSHHNWNQVCNGGIGMGALAIGDEEPALAGEILHDGLKSLQLPMREFAPDGAWNEGPGYWNYATTYNVVILAALKTALGTDFGLPQIPGFAEAGTFPIYLTGPLGRTFNYADGSDGTIRAPHMFWLARQFNRPAYARYQRPIATPHPLDLLWFDPALDLAQASDPALDKYFRNVEVATFRSAWDVRDALFVGFKAGDNKANHSNLDLGTFVLDALGVRWAVDLGADDYNLPGYFGQQRWTYYRMRAEGHNTLVINPGVEPDQDPAAAARIIRYDSKPDRALAIADLTPAYAKQARKVTRGLAVLKRQQVLVQDEVQSDQPAEVWWFFHTPAQVKVSDDGKSATLSQGEKRFQTRLVSPAKATFVVLDAQPLPTSPHPERQNKNDGVRKLAVHLTGVKDLCLAVLFVPREAGATVPEQLPNTVFLQQW
jgi:hypothetical protein